MNPSRMMMVPRDQLYLSPPGDPLFDPRSQDPPDLAMAKDIAARVLDGECANTRAIPVRDEPQADGSRRLRVVDGHTRTNASGEAQKELRKLGALPRDGALMVLVEFWEGDDGALILERLRQNDHDRFVKRDRASVLAFRVKQLLGFGKKAKEIAQCCPRDVGPSEVEALSHWANLMPECQRRFDDGAPLGLLAAVLETPRGYQLATLDKLLADGLRTTKGATRRTNTDREKAGEPRPMRALRPAKCLEVAKRLRALDVSTLAAGEPDFVLGFAAACAVLGGAKKPGKVPAAVLDTLKAVRSAKGKKLEKRKTARAKGGKLAARKAVRR